MTHVLDRLRYWLANEPTRYADRLAAFLLAVAGGALVAVDELLAAAVAAAGVVIHLVVAYYVRDRVVPTNARLKPDVIERLERRWRAEANR